MSITSLSASGVLFLVLSGLLDVSGVWAVYEPIVNKRVGRQAEKISAEEALLSFRIEEVTKRASPSRCAEDRRLQRDRRMLDPQLLVPAKRRNLNLASPDICKEVELLLPMSR